MTAARTDRPRPAGSFKVFVAVVAIGTVLSVLTAGCSGRSAPSSADPSTPASTSSGASTLSPASTAPPPSARPASPEGGASEDPGKEPADPLARYEEPSLDFSLTYPGSWKLTETVGVGHGVGGEPIKTVGAFDSTGNRDGDVLLEGVAVSVFKLAVVVNAELLPTFREKVEDRVSLLQAGLFQVETIEELHDTRIDGSPAFETTFRFINEGRRMRTRLVFVVSGDLEYQLTAQAADASYDVSRPQLDQALESFKLEH